MGISDDITPRHNHRRLHSHSSQNLQAETAAKSTDFVKVQEIPVTPDTSKIFSDASDDFFANNYHKEKKQKETSAKDNDKKTSQKARLISGWIIIILLVCLSTFLVLNNFQKIKRLFKLETPKVTTVNSEETNDQLDTYVSEIKPQDYTIADTPTTTAENKPANSTSTATVFDKTSLKIQVLNGNGITNSASVIKKTLETAGFKISSTGNASNFAYEKTFVYYKTGKDEGANLVKNALKDKIVTLEKSDTKTKTYDIVVVVGKQ